MLWMVVMVLLLAVAAQARASMRLGKRLATLEQRLATRARSEERGCETPPSREDREPLLLTQIAPPDPREPLLLDTPLPEAANDGLETSRPRINELRWPLTAVTAQQLWRQHGMEAISSAVAFAVLAGPAIFGAAPSRATTLLCCVVAIAAFGICLWRRFAGAMFATFAGLLWAFAAAIIEDAPADALVMLGVGVLGGAAAGIQAREKQRSTWNTVASRAPGISVAVSSALALLAWMSASQAPLGATAHPALFGIALVALAATLVRTRLAAAAALTAAVLGLLVGALAYLRARFPLPVGGDFYLFALLSALGIVAATCLARPHHQSRKSIAGFGAVGAGLLVLMAATTRPDWHSAAAWGTLTLGSSLLGAGAWATSKGVADPTNDRGVDFWLLGSAALAALALESALAEAARPLGHAILASAWGFAAARLGWRGLGYAAVGAALLALASALSHAGDGWFSQMGSAFGAVLIGYCSTTLRTQRIHREWLIGVAGAMVLVVLFSALSWAAKAAGLDALAHNALRALLLLGAGVAIVVRGAPGEGLVARWSGEVLILAGLALALVGSGLVLNPWWGVDPTPVQGVPLLNSLLLSFAAPAVLALVPASQLKQRTRWAEDLCRAASGCLALIWAVLEIRRTFRGEVLDQGAMMPVEAALYALLALFGAIALTWLSRHRRGLQRFARAATWAALALAAMLLLGVANPWWGAAAPVSTYAAAAVLQAGAAAAAYFLAAERALGSNAVHRAALLCALAFCWSAGHGAIHGLVVGALAGAEPLMHTIWPLGLALCVWSMRRRAIARDVGAIAMALIWVGLTTTAAGLLVVFSPWWGLRPATLAQPLAAIAGLSLYALAAWLSALAADMRQAPSAYWLQRAGLALSGAHLLAFLILTARRLHHEDMTTPSFADAENWSYVVALGAFSAGSFWYGVRRNSALLRLGALAALACAVVCFFFLAFSRLSGFPLAGAVIGALGLLTGCLWFASIYRPKLRTPRRAAFGR